MENEKLPIKFFAPRKVDEMRVEGAGNNTPPKWLLTGERLKLHSEKLIGEFENFSERAKDRIKSNSIIPFVFIVKLFETSTSKSRRKFVTALFETPGVNNVIGLVHSDKLMVKIDSLAINDNFKERLIDYEQNSYAISCIEAFNSFEPLFETSQEAASCSYKIKLIDYQDYEKNISIQRFFEQVLKKLEIKYKKVFYSRQLPIYKVPDISTTRLDTFKMEDIYDVIFSIEPMPKYSIGLDSLSENSEISIQYPKTDKNYRTLGILDTGISSIPQLSPWLSAKKWSPYPDSVIDQSHGTFVAGIASYGDLCEAQDWVGHDGIKLFDATVFPDTTKEGLEEDELIHNIREAIEANHEEVKIWNLSISITYPVRDDKFSDFALALDDLQDKFNILICKSAGNCFNFLQNKPRGRIHEGADSVRSLVVGSVAHQKGDYDISEIDNPSPFSRIGPGPEYIIKPEVSHYGGNAGLSPNGNRSVTGVKSFSKNGQLIADAGTSFSTPRVASLATSLYQDLEGDFDPLLIKTLIIHSATYPKNLNIPVNERTKQLGFGIPQRSGEIIYNDPHEATLILRGNLSKGQYIDIMDFPMPKELIKNGFYTGQVIATLVYEPILDPTQGSEYCQSNIDIKFGSYDSKQQRDMDKKNILNPVGRKGAKNLFLNNVYSNTRIRENQGDFALRERLLIKYGDKYYPVKKYAVDLEDISTANKHKYLTEDKHWYLKVQGLFRDNIEQKAARESLALSQEMCLIITIRDPNLKETVYDSVTRALNSFHFWHSNIKLTSDVSVNVLR